LPDDFEERAAEIEETHRANPVKEELRGMSLSVVKDSADDEDKYNDDPASHWNKFYGNHQEG
jgi:hypothetical protein